MRWILSKIQVIIHSRQITVQQSHRKPNTLLPLNKQKVCHLYEIRKEGELPASFSSILKISKITGNPRKWNGHAILFRCPVNIKIKQIERERVHQNGATTRPTTTTNNCATTTSTNCLTKFVAIWKYFQFRVWSWWFGWWVVTARTEERYASSKESLVFYLGSFVTK